MTQTLKCLAQLVPTANTLTDLYVVPAATQTAVSSFVIFNSNSSSINFLMSVARGGAADMFPAQYILNQPIDGYDSFVGTIGMSLNTTDVVRVQSDTAHVAFSLFGTENT